MLVLLFLSLFYLLGQLAGQELVELGVEDAVGDELVFFFLLKNRVSEKEKKSRATKASRITRALLQRLALFAQKKHAC